MIIKVTINGNEYEVRDGETILNVCQKLGVFVPHLCYLKSFSPSGVCGLCVVEFDDGKVSLSCLTNIKDGMKIKTESKRLDKIRKINIDRLLKNHNIECFSCIQNGTCDLQSFAAKIYEKCKITSDEPQKKMVPSVLEVTDKFVHDRGKCINCLKCVKFLNKVCDKNLKRIEAFESIDNANDMILNAVDICPTNALQYEKNLISDFLCEECETYDIDDVFTPKLLVFKSDNEIVKTKSIRGDYLNDKTRLLLKNIPQRVHIEDDYNRVINSLTEKIKFESHEKSIFVIGDNIDIISFYYLKALSEKCENICICVNDSKIPKDQDIKVGIKKLDLISVDVAFFIGGNSTIDKYHISSFSTKFKAAISLDIEDLDQFFIGTDDGRFFGYTSPYLFIDSSVFSRFDSEAIFEKIKNFEDEYNKKYLKPLKVRILPGNLCQMIMEDISDKISLNDLFDKFNKHDIKFICVIGDSTYDLKSEEIFTVYNSVLKKAGNEYIPSKHFTEDSTYYVNIFGEIVKTNEIIKTNIKSNREFLFDLMKNVFKDEFDDINFEIHESIRKRFFV